MSSGRGGGGSAKNFSVGGAGGSDQYGAGVARLETEMKEHKKEIKDDFAKFREEVGKLRDDLNAEAKKFAHVGGGLQQLSNHLSLIKWVIGLFVVLGAGTIGYGYISTNNLSKDIHRLEIAIISSKPQVPAPNSR